jgi:hypothetical protein
MHMLMHICTFGYMHIYARGRKLKFEVECGRRTCAYICKTLTAVYVNIILPSD